MKLKIIYNFDFIINEKMLNFVYLPIIGNKAINLYNFLYNQSNFNKVIGNNISYDLNDLIVKLDLNIDEFNNLKALLEAIGLLKTYLDQYKNNEMYIELIPALTWNEFKQNNKYYQLLRLKISEIEYERIKYCFNTTINSNLVDVSTPFEKIFSDVKAKQLDYLQLIDEVFKTTNQLIEIDECLKHEINELYENDFLTYNEILSCIFQSFYKIANEIKIDKNIFLLKSKAIINSKNIQNFNIDIKKNRNLNIFLQNFNNDELNKMLDNYKALNSEQYLANIQASSISEIDKNLIDLLRRNYQLPDFIINLLIDFSILVNKGKIEPIYIQQIAITINRLNYNNIHLVLNHLKKTAKYKVNHN